MQIYGIRKSEIKKEMPVRLLMLIQVQIRYSGRAFLRRSKILRTTAFGPAKMQNRQIPTTDSAKYRSLHGNQPRRRRCDVTVDEICGWNGDSLISNLLGS
jgi:hypothetical protein